MRAKRSSYTFDSDMAVSENLTRQCFRFQHNANKGITSVINKSVFSTDVVICEVGI